ncbi:hypothetical protein [Streptosporangium sp. LJ11]|uniref:hypothetical protein n=1 Tax=Streptosporangium sp. LJ11 TaxID=3436927 RepID=UPI003F7AFD2C
MQSPTYLHDLLVSTLFTEGLDVRLDREAAGRPGRRLGTRSSSCTSSAVTAPMC